MQYYDTGSNQRLIVHVDPSTLIMCTDKDICCYIRFLILLFNVFSVVSHHESLYGDDKISSYVIISKICWGFFFAEAAQSQTLVISLIPLSLQ